MLRMLPEWHPQDAIMLTWPHADSDWSASLPVIESTLEAMAVAISRYQTVLIVVDSSVRKESLTQRLIRLGAERQRLQMVIAASDDTWTRDHGPLAIVREGIPELLDYRFTGWGGKFPAERDNALNQTLAEASIWQAPLHSKQDLVLEGDALETDGQGTLLTTEACLLNPNRNPQYDRHAIEQRLAQDLGIERVLWLRSGHLEGDDTDSHIDTLARFCDTGTIAHVHCDDPSDPHFEALAAMERELQQLRQPDGSPYRLVALPWPRPCFDPDDGHRLPATYANFLIINGAVLVPIHADAADARALQAMATVFPERDIIPIDCRSVIRQHGSLHCLTMQLPQGTLFNSAAEVS
ncbi:agmatine deiminase family protein [Kushneria phosphatilytica]|uniref:agmatine deiminase family protein n=1 Tax=Kushneria phosphatilytica TaxID=657387 RepID=UPI0009FFA99C|nr:agmatine deiminase family protein [Kushneria phosphatilytica]